MRACGSIVISGLENCKLDFEKEIKVNAYREILVGAKLKPADGGEIKLSLEFMYTDDKVKNGYELRDIIYEIARQIVYQFLDKQIDIFNISFSEPSISYLGGSKVIAVGFKEITSINDESLKTYINDLEISIENYDEKKLLMVSQLEEKSQVLRYTNLYERLKNVCGGNQIAVTNKIRDRFSDEYNIKCDNENIDVEYAEKHRRAKYQDDFTYLRTMIAHGGNGNYSDEIYSRLRRDTIKIVKVLNILEKEQESEDD